MWIQYFSWVCVSNSPLPSSLTPSPLFVFIFLSHFSSFPYLPSPFLKSLKWYLKWDVGITKDHLRWPRNIYIRQVHQNKFSSKGKKYYSVPYPRLFLSYIPNKWTKCFLSKYFTFQWWYQKKCPHFQCNTGREEFTLFSSLHVYKDITRASTLLFEIVLDRGGEKKKKKQAFPPLLQIFKPPYISVFLGYNNIFYPFII